VTVGFFWVATGREIRNGVTWHASTRAIADVFRSALITAFDAAPNSRTYRPGILIRTRIANFADIGRIGGTVIIASFIYGTPVRSAVRTNTLICFAVANLVVGASRKIDASLFFGTAIARTIAMVVTIAWIALTLSVIARVDFTAIFSVVTKSARLANTGIG
jgi:hypothetical protein